MYYVYILHGERYYVGYTNSLENRIKQHMNKKVYSTSRLGNIELVGYFVCDTKSEAIQLEAKIKRSKNIKRYIDYTGFIKV